LPQESYSFLVIAGFALVMLGVLLIFAGVFLSALSGASKGSVEAGGVVFIGPIPILFGTSSRAALLAGILALVMIAIYIIIILFMARRIL